MSRPKIVLDDTEKEQLEELALKGLSSYKIAKKLGLSQPTIFRNLQLLGLNRERKIVVKKIPQDENFNWDNFNKRIMF